MNAIKQRIRDHCRWLREIGMPPARVSLWESQLLRAYDRMAADEVARTCMGRVGVTAASEMLHVDRSTVYRRAARAARKSRKLQNTATV